MSSSTQCAAATSPSLRAQRSFELANGVSHLGVLRRSTRRESPLSVARQVKESSVMSSHHRSFARPLPLTPLAACLAALFAVSDTGATPAHPTGAVVVANCLDSGPGSLRQAVIDSGPGD